MFSEQRAYLLLLLLVAACAAPGDKTNSAEEILRSGKGGDFRGINIGDQKDQVVIKEGGRTVYEMPDELVYRIGSEGHDSAWYEISYNFNQEGLYDIMLEIFPKDEGELKELRNDFIAFYLDKYGDCEYRDGYCQWRTMTENGHIVNIVLTDSTASQRPCLKVNFAERENE